MSEEKKVEQDPQAYWNEVYQKLSTPFPEEALSVDSSRGFDLTSLKAQYIVERLNLVLGFNNWAFNGNFEEREDGSVIYQGQIVLKNSSLPEDYKYVTHNTIGYSGKKKNTGDTYKSARTDALSKGCSLFGVGNDIFKGKVAPPSKKPTPSTKPNTQIKTNNFVKKPASFQGKVAKKVSTF